MNKAEQNYRLLLDIEANRQFLLAAYRQNPHLLENAEDRIKEILSGTRPPEPGTRNSQRGISLIELVLFIVIVGIALAGVLLVMNRVTASSADPLVRKQALAIAESLLEEVELMPFTFCDPDDPNAASAVSASVGGGGCNSTVEVMGPENAFAEQPTAETRYHLATPFDNVNDYHGFNMAPGAILDITGTNTGLNGYSAGVAISSAGIALLNGTDDGAALRITVTVTAPDGSQVVLDGYRTRHSPRI